MSVSARRLASIADAADYYSCSPKTIRRRIADGSLTAYRLGPKIIRVDLNELDDQLKPIPTVASVGVA